MCLHENRTYAAVKQVALPALADRSNARELRESSEFILGNAFRSLRFGQIFHVVAMQPIPWREFRQRMDVLNSFIAPENFYQI